jgi:GntR family transcriptional repressor for pyruvate dehydrogenase complex
MLDNLKRIDIDNPVDKIIKQIKDLVAKGDISPGEKLPPERKLAEHFGVKRGQVREALRKLEFYGILKTLPQSGTIVTGIGIVALEGLISDILEIEESDFKSLVETRILLEKQAAYYAATRRNVDDIIALQNTLKDYEYKLLNGESAVEEDLLFHIKIAEASKNTVLKSLMLIITPDIIHNFKTLRVCDTTDNLKTIEEHRDILNHIINQKPNEALNAMGSHLDDIQAFSIANDVSIQKV